MTVDVAEELLPLAEDLYGLPLADFTPARDALVKQHKGSPLAAALKALRKPSTAAWVVDLLVRHETEQVEQVLAVGAALRSAQDSMSLAGAIKWTLSSRIFTSMLSVGAPGMANSTMSLSCCPSAYATVTGATFIRSTCIIADIADLLCG